MLSALAVLVISVLGVGRRVVIFMEIDNLAYYRGKSA